MPKTYKILYELYDQEIAESNWWSDEDDVPEHFSDKTDEAVTILSKVVLYLEQKIEKYRVNYAVPYTSWNDVSLNIASEESIDYACYEAGIRMVEFLKACRLVEDSFYIKNVLNYNSYFDEKLKELNDKLLAINKVKEKEIEELEANRQELKKSIGFDAS